jgi:molybdenum cofactor cytidylyltransferase|tara:strand:- start:69 stop:683 length:615 start_codon:yes stop_codon:yes gene_type:complete
MLSTDSRKNIVMVILAAGNSSRMNAVKQLLPWKDGTLLTNAIEVGISSMVSSIIVVLGANSDKIKPSLKRLNVTVIENSQWKNGLGTSLAFAVNYMEDNNIYADGVLCCLADMPFVTVKHLHDLIAGFELDNNSIVATSLKESVMVPALFDAFYFKDLVELTGDSGAKELLIKHQNNLIHIEVSSEKVLKDLDTPSDYNFYKKS